MGRRAVGLTLIIAAFGLAGCGSSAKTSSHGAGSTGVTSTPTATTATASTASTTTAGATTTAAAKAPAASFEHVPLQTGAQIGAAATTQRGTIDGIQCAPLEQLKYHIHAHLLVFDNGQERSLPGGIGIAGSKVEILPNYGPVAIPSQTGCFYWLHTHAPDGVIHIESPTSRIYTLGNFFDEWHQPLTRTVIGSVKGRQTWTVNGKPWTKNPRDIRLLPHAVIQVSVGTPIAPFRPVNWTITGL